MLPAGLDVSARSSLARGSTPQFFTSTNFAIHSASLCLSMSICGQNFVAWAWCFSLKAADAYNAQHRPTNQETAFAWARCFSLKAANTYHAQHPPNQTTKRTISATLLVILVPVPTGTPFQSNDRINFHHHTFVVYIGPDSTTQLSPCSKIEQEVAWGFNLMLLRLRLSVSLIRIIIT